MTEETNYDQNAEIATLAAALMSQTARDDARKYVTGSDFYSPTHEVIWNTMSEQDRNGGCDPATMMSALTAKHHTAAMELLPRLVTEPVIPDHAVTYAQVVREWATRRRLIAEAIRTLAMARNPEHPANSLAATVATRFATVRDTGNTEDVETRTLGEVLAEEDDSPEWIIPDLLERRDRMILTGEEGLGKSFLLRQIAVLASAGVHPFEGYPIEPISVLVVDCENSLRQIRRKVRPVAAYARRHGEGDPLRMGLLPTRRMDLTADRDLAKLHKEVEAIQPDLVVIGPLYRLVPRALQTDDEAAPLLAALDTIRDKGAALLMEAHAGHATLGGKGGIRDMRPRGSSALLGWPEFGYGMRANDTPTKASLTPWRGDRDGRRWPLHLRHSADHTRWVPDESPDDPVTVW